MPAETTTVDRETGFIRELGLFDSVMIVVGVMIGSGIFIVSADMARDVGSAGWLLFAWLLTAALTVAAALSYGSQRLDQMEVAGEHWLLEVGAVLAPVVGGHGRDPLPSHGAGQDSGGHG